MVGRSYRDLRIALYEMKEEVERLEEELDAEREASATSVSEAMSVILRLHGEKAMLAMEASQYKRMVEERMSLAEYSLDLLEDLNYQKDVEIKNLECELLAYRCKLMSLGCSGIDEDCMRFCDRSQTPSLELINTVPVEKGVIEESLDSTRDQIKNFEELTEFRDSVRDQYKTPPQQGTVSSVSEAKNVKRMSKKSSKQKRETSVKRDQMREAECQAELQRLKERVERLERERCSKEPHQTSVIKQGGNMNLQRKPEESLSSEMFIYDLATVSVQEAMLYFWL